eukprot:CAMPEP_0194044742 /NCGR_PEP_ID=MMETSP0009_2-20130614/16157_1 /TAXON_ID=210454 /ORGANISM="Grammatophora oceanica, Strain CCMP 410" /LENGTH=161 /DNA_ID=CAMNT_0038689343 /DNA_START=39 /DNA_END=524 /DNA_ORIENTATION=-
MNHQNLTHVQAKVVTPHGDIRSLWKRTTSTTQKNETMVVFTQNLLLPPGTSTVLTVPIVSTTTPTSYSAGQSSIGKHHHQQHMRGIRSPAPDDDADASTIITEGEIPVWKDGHYVPGVAGVLNATKVGGRVELELSNGRFSFETTIAIMSSSPQLGSFIKQ